MSHFAKIINGKVVQVIVAEPEFFETFTGQGEGKWVQTSYNTRGNVHYGPDNQPDGGVALRGNYAGIGYTYDEIYDVFYAPSPFPSWVLNKQTWLWEPPISYPQDGKYYVWNEISGNWSLIESDAG